MNIELKSVVDAASRAVVFLRRHIHALLFVWLVMAIGAWGFIFWQYGYLVVFQQVETTSRPLVIKENDLNALLEKTRTQEEFQKTIVERSFSNPFVKFPEVQ